MIRRTGMREGHGWLAGAVLGLVVFAAAPLPAALSVRGGGGVIVDGVTIPASTIRQEYAYTYSIREIIHAKPRGDVNEQAFEKAVGSVVNRHLLSRAAAKSGIALTDEERAELRAGEVAAWRGEKGFATSLAMLKVSEQFLLQRKEMNLLARKLAEQDAFAGDALSEAAQRKFYDATRGKYLQPSPPLRYILLPPASDAKRIGEVTTECRRLAVAGQDFSSLVGTYSRHPSAGGGGIVTEGGSAAPWPDKRFAARVKPCRISEYRRDAAGIHLYARDCLLPLPFEAVRESVRKDLADKLIGGRQKALIAGLREQAAIEYLPGEPGAASPTGGQSPHTKPSP